MGRPKKALVEENRKPGRPRKAPVIIKAEEVQLSNCETHQHSPNKQRKPPTHKLTPEKLQAIKTANPNLTHAQIATLTGAVPSAVTKALQRYQIDIQRVDDYKSHRADLLAGVQERVLQTFTTDDLNKATLRDRTMLYGVLYDKERLERGQSTSNTSVLLQAVMTSFGGADGDN